MKEKEKRRAGKTEKTGKKEKERGVTFEKKLVFSGKRRASQGLLSYGIGMLCFCVFIMAVIACAVDGFSMEYDKKLLYGVVLLSGILFYTGFSMKKGGEFVVGVYLLFYMAVSFWQKERLTNGLAILLNHVLELAASYYHFSFTKYQVSDSMSMQVDLSCFLLFVFAFFIGILAYLLVNQLAFPVVLFLSLLLVLSPEMVGLIPATVPFIVYTILTISYAGSYGGFWRKKAENRRKRADLYWKVRLLQVAVGMVAAGIFLSLFSVKSYEAATQDKTLKVALQDFIDRQYNNIVRAKLDTGTVSGGINCGELGGVASLEYTDEDRLEVTTAADLDTNLYLRGYVGSSYEGKQWSALEGDALADRKRIEKQSGISVEDYGTASAVSLLKMEHFFAENEDFPSFYSPWRKYVKNGYFDELDAEFLGEPYASGNVISELQQVQKAHPTANILKQVQVKNLSETVSTIFAPYGIVGNLWESGRLSYDKVSDVGQYSFPVMAYSLQEHTAAATISNGLLECFAEENGEGMQGVQTRTDPRTVWRAVKKLVKLADEEFGIDVLSYEPGTYENVSIEALCEQNGVEAFGNGDADLFFCTLRNSYRMYLMQQDYEQFAQKAYTEVPENLQETLDTVLAEAKLQGEEDVLDIAARIQAYLYQNTEYSLTPGVTPEEEDFVEYFLATSRKGFCVHYASAATLLFRRMGIPARYVEGYLLNPDMVSYVFTDTNEKAYTISDRYAHAWVEIYLSGYGWVPVEVTKGYMALSDSQLERLDAIDNEKTTNKNLQTQAPQVVTPSPAIKSTPLTGATASPESAGKQKMPPIFHVVWIGIRVLAGGLLVVLALFARRKWRDVRDAWQEKQADPDVRVALYYKKLEHLLRVWKVLKKTQSFQNALQEESVEVAQIPSEEWTNLLKILNRHAFSRQGATAQDAADVCALYHLTKKHFLEGKSFLAKWYYRYIVIV